MLASGRKLGKRRLCRAVSDRFSLINTTSSNQRTYLLRKCYDAFKCANYVPVSGASTTADEFGYGKTTAGPPPYSPSLVNGDGGLWRPFFAHRHSGMDDGGGRRFFARLSGAKPLVQPRDDSIATESWRQSQSEDTYDLDERIVQLLTLEAKRLPKPCDPLTYRFWDRGMSRRFEPVRSALDRAPGPNSEIFTVCSYNVLCQRTLSCYVEKLYSHCPFEHLTWQRRWPLLAVELQMLDSDVFCLQEVQHDHFEQAYLPLLSKLGYDGTFKKKLGKKSDGCATFWKRDKFRPVLVHSVEYSFPAPHEHSDSVALITVFEPSGAGGRGRVAVANTHLIHQPACGATKLCQAALLLAHLQNVTERYRTEAGPTGLIVCGDFNSTPFSPLYSLMVEGQLRYEGLTGWSISGQQQNHQQNPRFRRLNAIGDAALGTQLLPHGSECSEMCTLTEGSCRDESETESSGALSHKLNLRSVYDHVTKNGEREVTTFLRDQPVAVDYIFYSVENKKINKSNDNLEPWTTSDVKENGLRCLERYRLPGPSHLSSTIGYLPNQYCASDHLPLMAKFALER